MLVRAVGLSPGGRTAACLSVLVRLDRAGCSPVDVRAGVEQLRRDTSAGAFAFLDQIARTQMKVWRELLERRWGAVTPADNAAWTGAHVIGPADAFLTTLELPETHRLRALMWEFSAGSTMVIRRWSGRS